MSLMTIISIFSFSLVVTLVPTFIAILIDRSKRYKIISKFSNEEYRKHHMLVDYIQLDTLNSNIIILKQSIRLYEAGKFEQVNDVLKLNNLIVLETDSKNETNVIYLNTVSEQNAYLNTLHPYYMREKNHRSMILVLSVASAVVFTAIIYFKFFD